MKSGRISDIDFIIHCCFSVSMTAIICSASVLLNLSIPFILVLLCMLQSMSAAIIEDYSYYLMMKFDYKFRTMLMIVPNLLSVVLSILAMSYVLTQIAIWDELFQQLS